MTTLLSPTEVRSKLRSLGYSPIPVNGKRRACWDGAKNLM
jgi:hypothetical protein